MAVAARIVADASVTTLAALIDMAAERRGAAKRSTVERPRLLARQSTAVGEAGMSNDVGQFKRWPGHGSGLGHLRPTPFVCGSAPLGLPIRSVTRVTAKSVVGRSIVTETAILQKPNKGQIPGPKIPGPHHSAAIPFQVIRVPFGHFFTVPPGWNSGELPPIKVSTFTFAALAPQFSALACSRSVAASRRPEPRIRPSSRLHLTPSMRGGVKYVFAGLLDGHKDYPDDWESAKLDSPDALGKPFSSSVTLPLPILAAKPPSSRGPPTEAFPRGRCAPDHAGLHRQGG